MRGSGGIFLRAFGVHSRCETGGGTAVQSEAGDLELRAAIGEVDHRGGYGGVSGDDAAGVVDSVLQSQRTAERGVVAEGRGVRTEVGDRTEGRWGQPTLAAISEWEPHCRAAGDGCYGARLLGGESFGDR